MGKRRSPHWAWTPICSTTGPLLLLDLANEGQTPRHTSHTADSTSCRGNWPVPYVLQFVCLALPATSIACNSSQTSRQAASFGGVRRSTDTRNFSYCHTGGYQRHNKGWPARLLHFCARRQHQQAAGACAQRLWPTSGQERQLRGLRSAAHATDNLIKNLAM
jgi:hypothetical protein